MTITIHKRSVHIDAPVDKVFDHVKDPVNFYEAFPDISTSNLTDVTMTPDAVGSTYTFDGKMFVFHVHGVVTREEYVPNQRIVDRSSTGPVWTFTFEPDATGTTLYLAFELSTKVPLLDKFVDHTAWHGDRDLDAYLANVKHDVET